MTGFSFVRSRGVAFALSLLLLAAGMVAWAVRGLNYNVEFTGGTAWTLRFEKPVEAGAIRSVLAEQGLDDAIVQLSEEGRVAFLRTPHVDQATQQKVLEALGKDVAPVQLEQFDSISPVIGREIKEKGLLALGLATVGMIVYMTVRFEFWFAVAAILAMLHDVFMVVGLFALLQWQVDASFIAALLTVFGYSINDTVVVFDRIRENLRLRRKEPLDELVDRSIRQVLRRSILTGTTTLLALAAVFAFGGETIRAFSGAMFFGIFFGTYSSIFVASPLWYVLRQRAARRAAEARAAG
ncbi:protein-export membrane protein SecF [Thermaerobacter marianensis DSM 12885]|uniref:Protein-export membrane protein SecF n=1 Tax=Thermaerobacter marianensis (strain ATCC 700841 / DSM 12885 / JCM 10246 / 7p75a) TaxID=644966 RepID=E6SLR1_THEM7|nr:protein translocase subunit SecF [Thermaerobacter marianensis]ADU51360.1 protein-export membrane protein SecF [Thermaerobacter marianensis DSM 12885]